ncbi:Uncharacterized metal-binding protein YceD, DUF177 family [Flexibacter flexilis DSM 6793]|uniref:Uncharacterized metal-binding protein YceD, DUF177 family n=1 Tax=Flexibacter flexilis DSM 6793 TaxID=927664 RepID=A0A1I1FWA9_9BACT|nr:DUF177 domain-containing protein [Flexibacter flexilis]SFC03605.1 Uncharacterized metal-binding protein YceD, DUF177 family [Flexibacter flexilis DSM 6793]
MKTLDKYSIDIFGLSNKRHEYDFEVGNAFFEAFGSELVEKGALQVQVVLDKTETMIVATFSIVGSVELICDRSLESFEQPVSVNQKMIYKFGEEDEDLSDEICIIAKDTHRLNIAQPIYDFIALSLPMKRIHPKFEDTQYPEDAEQEGLLVYSTATAEDDEPTDENNDTPSDEDTIDPRWAALQKLKGREN